MKNMMVKSLAFAAALAFCFPVASNAEAQFEWKASSSQVATHPVLQKGFFPLLDRLEKESGGKIHVTYYNPNTLMPQKTHYEALGKGLIDIANFGPSTEHTRFKATSALELPMMFTSAMAGTMTSWDMATGNDAFKKLAKTDISEDEIKQLEDELQKLTDKYVKIIDDMIEEKSKDILTV